MSEVRFGTVFWRDLDPFLSTRERRPPGRTRASG